MFTHKSVLFKNLIAAIRKSLILAPFVIVDQSDLKHIERVAHNASDCPANASRDEFIEEVVYPV